MWSPWASPWRQAFRCFSEDRKTLRPSVLIDDFNIYLIALTAFVGFTTSLFSARYIVHELESGGSKPDTFASIMRCSRA